MKTAAENGTIRETKHGLDSACNTARPLTGRPVFARSRLMRNTTKSPELINQFADRFWSHVDQSNGPDACWEWTRYRLPQGHGRVHCNGRTDYAHRIAWILSNGRSEVPAGMVVRHRCDNAPCCNPAHLELGTQLENMCDRATRGRSWYQKVDNSERDQGIISRYANGENVYLIASSLNCHLSAIYRVLAKNGIEKRRSSQSAGTVR